MPPEWHVIIAEPDDVDGFGRVRKGGDTGAITPERADKEFGWPVSRVLDGINAAALYEADRLGRPTSSSRRTAPRWKPVWPRLAMTSRGCKPRSST